MKSIEQLKKKDLNCNIFSVYDYDGLTITELLCQFFTKINECVDVSNESLDFLKWLKEIGLKDNVVEVLNQWIIDGTLEQLINEQVFSSLYNKIVTSSGEYINVVEYAKVNKISLDDAILELEGKKLFFPNGTHEINNLNNVNNVKGESETKTILKITSGRDIQTSGYTVFENLKIDLEGQGSLIAPKGDASATNLLKLYKVHICNAINGVITSLGTTIIDCEIYNCSNYGIYNKGTDCIIANTTVHNTDKAGLYNSSKSLRISNSKFYLTNRVDYSTGYAIENTGSTSYYSNIEIQQSRGGSLKLGGYGCMFQGATDGCSWFYPNIATDVLVEGEHHVVDLIQKNGSDFSGNHKTSWKYGLKLNCKNCKINSMLYNENRQSISNGVNITDTQILENDITINNQKMYAENTIYAFKYTSNVVERINPYHTKINLSANTQAKLTFKYDFSNKYSYLGYWRFSALFQSDKDFKIGFTLTDGTITHTIYKTITADWGKYSSLGILQNKYNLISEFEDKGGNLEIAECSLTFLCEQDHILELYCQNGNIFSN